MESDHVRSRLNKSMSSGSALSRPFRFRSLSKRSFIFLVANDIGKFSTMTAQNMRLDRM